MYIYMMTSYPFKDHQPEFLTVRREPARAEMERRLLPSINRLLAADPTLAKAADKSGVTTLHNAVVSGSIDIARTLIKTGADVNAKNDEGQTPLHMAVVYGCPDIAKLLIDHGADKLLGDKYGGTFVDYISSSGAGIFPKDAKEYFNIDANAPLKEPAKDHPGDQPNCTASGGWEGTTPANDGDDLQCDIDQLTDLTPEKWYKEYYLRGRPVLIRNELPLSERCGLSKASVLQNPLFDEGSELGVGSESARHKGGRSRGMPGKASFRCGATAYPSITRQKKCPKMCSLDILNNGEMCELPPDPTTGKSRSYKPITVLVPPGGRSFERGTWKNLVSSRYHHNYFPSYKQVCPVFHKHIKHQLFMGGKLAGATMHFHAHAYNMLFFGYKKWNLLPPRYTEMSGMSALDYMEDAKKRGIKPYTCTQRPGDLVIVPRMYGHATLNEYGFGIGIGSLFVDQNSEISHVAHHEKSGSREVPGHMRGYNPPDRNQADVETGFSPDLKQPYPAWAAYPWRTNQPAKQKPRAAHRHPSHRDPFAEALAKRTL